jgi:GrpB-like predicted nucleotidyltransferase (UPF0157 family)
MPRVNRPVVIVAPDPAWNRRFASEAAVLRASLGEPLLAVHHVGSTSVPGLWAKDTVDVLPVVRDLADVDAARTRLEAAGLEWRGEYGIPGRRYLVRIGADPSARATNVHVYAPAHPEIARHLAFRDHLRAHPQVAAAYGALKRELARVHGDARQSYQDGKSAFIEDVLRTAMAAAYVGPVGA